MNRFINVHFRTFPGFLLKSFEKEYLVYLRIDLLSCEIWMFFTIGKDLFIP